MSAPLSSGGPRGTSDAPLQRARANSSNTPRALQITRTASNRPVVSDPPDPPPPAVRIRRLPSSNAITQRNVSETGQRVSRRRSASAPIPPHESTLAAAALQREATATPALPTLTEETSAPHAGDENLLQVSQEALPARSTSRGRIRAISNAARSFISSPRPRSEVFDAPQTENYRDGIVDVLDVIDPQVSTLNTLNNLQNSLFIPYLGPWLNRRPTYVLDRSPIDSSGEEEPAQEKAGKLEPLKPSDTVQKTQAISEPETPQGEAEGSTIALQPLTHSHTLSSVLSGTSVGHNYAVLPHGTILEGWSEDDKAELNDYVRHLLHSRRAGFKRKMRGFGKYVQKPLGAFVTIYAFLLTFWGAAWVFFLIGWIYAGTRQAYFIEICDQILTALFCMVGLGLAPFRAVDTYHMIYIAHYHFLTWRLRREKRLPDLHDPNDLPKPRPEGDLELARATELESVVLSPEQQKKLMHHEKMFSRSHTFYKPHETFTHNAFSVRFLIAIVVLLDCHSCFQAALGGTTWGINYHRRPKALTAVILSCSISCNISGGTLIAIGDKRARKKHIAEQMFRQDLTEYAMVKMSKKKGLSFSLSATKDEEAARAQGIANTQKTSLFQRIFRRKPAHKEGEKTSPEITSKPSPPYI